jgi:hypothetical protein
MDERVTSPVLEKVDGMNEFGAVEGSLDGNLGVVGSLLYDHFGRLEVGVQFGGGDLVQHLVEQEEWCHRWASTRRKTSGYEGSRGARLERGYSRAMPGREGLEKYPDLR